MDLELSLTEIEPINVVEEVENFEKKYNAYFGALAVDMAEIFKQLVPPPVDMKKWPEQQDPALIQLEESLHLQRQQFVRLGRDGRFQSEIEYLGALKICVILALQEKYDERIEYRWSSPIDLPITLSVRILSTVRN